MKTEIKIQRSHKSIYIQIGVDRLAILGTTLNLWQSPISDEWKIEINRPSIARSDPQDVLSDIQETQIAVSYMFRLQAFKVYLNSRNVIHKAELSI